VHIVLNKEELNTISAEASKTPNVAKFTILPSMGVAFPLSANTSDMKYGVEMSWDPQIITPGQSTRFYIGLSELFSDKKQRPATFDFVLKQNDVELFRKAISGQTNVEKGNFVDYIFSPENVGTIVILVEKINGNAQSSVNFVASVSQKAQTFPIRLTSVSENKTPGKYYVDLTWVPKDLPITEAAEFIMTIYDKESGLPVGQASYDFVLIKGNSEIYRKSGLAASGGSFEGFKFSSGDVGNLMLRIEKINGSNEFVEIPITVTPEFPTGTLLVLVVTLSMIVIFSKRKFAYSFSSS
jgi:predicted secreted protein with PEFG-CTERM motif